MKTELIYLNDDKNIFSKTISSEGYIFIPQEQDTLLHEGWGYIVGSKEFYYEDNTTKVIIHCYQESKKRK